MLRCIDGDEAWASIDGSILVLIFAMLIVGAALETTGAVELIVSVLEPYLSGLPPLATLFAVYFIASILTETVTNNVVAVMFAASASFATPIGYQTNTLVYGAGNYKFVDFLKIGVPMNLIVGLTSVTAISIFFPL